MFQSTSTVHLPRALLETFDYNVKARQSASTVHLLRAVFETFDYNVKARAAKMETAFVCEA